MKYNYTICVVSILKHLSGTNVVSTDGHGKFLFCYVSYIVFSKLIGMGVHNSESIYFDLEPRSYILKTLLRCPY
jgi:hypothetical protein